MERLAAAAAKAGVETQFTPTEAVQGLQNLAQQGFTANQQLGALMPALLLSGASGGKVPLADAAKLTAQVVKGFGRDAEDAGIMVDQMVRTTTKSGMAIENLAGAMQYASSAAQNMDVDFRSTLATLGLIKNIIPSAEVAGSAFQIFTARLSKPLNQKKLKENLGIDVIDKATGEFRGFGALLLDISDKAEGMAGGKRAAIIQDVFGPRGMKGVVPLLTQLQKGITTETGQVLKGQAAWKYWMETLDPETVKGFAESMNEMKLDTMNGQLQLLTGSLQTFMMEFGKGSAQFTKGIVKAFIGGFNTFLSLFQELPQGLKTGAAGFIMIAGSITKFMGVLLLARVGLRLFGFSLSGLLLGVVKMLALALPVTLFFGGIALWAWGVYRAVSGNFGRAEKSTASFADKIKMAFKGIVDIVKTGGLSKATEKEFLKMGASPMLSAFFKRFIQIWRNAQAFFTGVIEGFQNSMGRLEGPWNRFTDTVTRIFNIWTGGASQGISATDKWTGKGVALGDTMVDLSVVVLELATNFATMSEKVAEAFKDVTLDDAVGAFKGLLKVLEGIYKVISGIMGFFDTFGTAIGEGAATLATSAEAGWMELKAAFTGDKNLMKLALAKREGAWGGSFVAPSDVEVDAGKRLTGVMTDAMKNFQSTKSLAMSREALAQQAATQSPLTTEGLGRKDRRRAEAQNKMAVEKANDAIARITEELSQRKFEILSKASTGAYEKADTGTQQMMREELRLINQKLASTPKVMQVNVDGKKLFDVVMERTAEDKEDNFDNLNMSPVTQ